MADWHDDPLSLQILPAADPAVLAEAGVRCEPVPGHDGLLVDGRSIIAGPDGEARAACGCHEPVIEDGLITGLRPSGAPVPDPGRSRLPQEAERFPPGLVAAGDWRADLYSAVFPQPLSIASHQAPWGEPYPSVYRKLWPVPGHGPWPSIGQIQIHPDGSVSTPCPCHEPVVDDDLILGLRPVPA